MMSRLVPKLRFKEFSGEWDKKPINKILTIGSGKDYKHLSSGDIPVYGTGGYMLSVNDYLYDGESVCIGRKGTIDKPMLLTGKFWTVDTLFYTHSFKNNIPKFIYALFLKINWYKYNEASGVPSLSKVTIGKIDIFIPTPKEQQKIASCLSSLDSLIEAQNKKVSALKQHKKGLMQQLFPAEGEREPKLRFKAFSGEWEERELEDVGNIVTGTTPSTKKDKFYQEGVYPWVTPTDITEKKDIFNTKKSLTQKGLDVGRFVPRNSLLVTCIASIGKNTILRKNGSCNQQINSITPYKDCNVDFLYYLIEEKNYILKENAGQGGMAMLNKNDFSNLKFCVSHEIKEQQKIANTLSTLDSLIEVQNQQINHLKQHKKGLMQQMFVSSEVGV